MIDQTTTLAAASTVTAVVPTWFIVAFLIAFLIIGFITAGGVVLVAIRFGKLIATVERIGSDQRELGLRVRVAEGRLDAMDRAGGRGTSPPTQILVASREG